MADLIRTYLDKLKTVQTAERDANATVRKLTSAVSVLTIGGGANDPSAWKAVRVDGIPVGIPRQPTGGLAFAEEWPTKAEVESKMLQFWIAIDEAILAWNAIPNDERFGLTPPPQIK